VNALTVWRPAPDSVHCMDWQLLMQALPDKSVDMILTDMPYGTTACVWDVKIDLAAWWKQIKRVMKPRGAVVMTASQPFTSELVMSNRDWFKYSLVWVKTISTGFQHVHNKPLKIHEDVLVFSPGTTAHVGQSENRMDYFPQKQQGQPYVRKQVTPNVTKIMHHASKSNLDYVGTVAINEGWRMPNSVLHFPNPNHNNHHDTQKPVALFEYLIRTYTQPDALVFDPFVGSGTTAVAAKSTGRHFICGDTDPGYVETARRRVFPVFGHPPTPV